MNIDTCSLIVEVNCSVWTARKLDKSTTDEVVTAKSAKAKDAARVNKNLMAGLPHLERITKHVTGFRTYVYANTLPWSDSGLRLLPTKNYMPFTQRVVEYEEEFTDLVDDFCKVYPQLITAQAFQLGDMFRRDDYPSDAEVRNRFAFRVNYMPLPSSGDFRIDVGNEAQEELKATYEKLMQERVDNAVADLRERLKEHLTRMSDRLTSDVVDGELKRRRFHDTLVSGAYELCDMLRLLNVTNDTQLAQACEKLEGALAGRNAEDLREQDTAREDVRSQVDDILKMFKGL